MTNLIIRKNQATWGEHTFPCAIGRSGIVSVKTEGDGGTPVGSFPFRKVYYRADRIPHIETSLLSIALQESDGWCDDPDSHLYNRPVSLPFSGSHEKLWREDHLYDIILVVGHNDSPPIPGKGSAIFVHIREPEGKPTEGCVAFSSENLLQILEECDAETQLVVER